jgi:hypothetical protein
MGHPTGFGHNPYFPVSPGIGGSPLSLQQQQQNGYEIL